MATVAASSTSWQHRHESEWVYSTLVSRALHLNQINGAIHQLRSLPHAVEFAVFLCGYAFNPVAVPFWAGLVYRLASVSAASDDGGRHDDETDAGKVKGILRPLTKTAFFLATVLLTLLFTEILKASFATTRPERILAETEGSGVSTKGDDRPVLRRYASLVTSLKSKHSFPSGDSAQAANLCLFLFRYLPAAGLATADMMHRGAHGSLLAPRDMALFGIFLPGVCFARVFYRCHWIEDCVGGVALAAFLHKFLVPGLHGIVSDLVLRLV